MITSILNAIGRLFCKLFRTCRKRNKAVALTSIEGHRHTFIASVCTRCGRQ